MSDDTGVGRQLVRLQVDGLLGRFAHDISFDPEWQFLILHGPNGIGKTRLLELIYSVFSARYLKLATLPFMSARFDFADRSWIEVSRGDHQRPPALLTEDGTQRAQQPVSNHLDWQIGLPDETIHRHTMKLPIVPNDDRLVARLEHRYPVEQVDIDSWLDHVEGDLVSFYELVERYTPSLPSFALPESIPDTFVAYLDYHNVHLIETQRLLHRQHSLRRHSRQRERQPTQQPTVVSYASNLIHTLDAVLAANSRTSQALDRSFPSRLFTEDTTTENEDQLRRRYDEQQQLRSRLAKIAILDSSPDLQLPERELKSWERIVLRTYLDDASDKLETFQSLLDRLELMRDIVNEKFLFKHLHIDREEGFVFRDTDSGIRVDLRQLSSGEQHELVLLYDLLMNVAEQSLVLIDEPEISLHVAWQKSFLDDVDRVASLTAQRFIIATHSPQIIGRWWERAVELYTHDSYAAIP